MFNFIRKANIFSTVAVLFCISTSNVWKSQFKSYILTVSVKWEKWLRCHGSRAETPEIKPWLRKLFTSSEGVGRNHLLFSIGRQSNKLVFLHLIFTWEKNTSFLMRIWNYSPDIQAWNLDLLYPLSLSNCLKVVLGWVPWDSWWRKNKLSSAI